MSVRLVTAIGVSALLAVAVLIYVELFRSESHTYGRITISSPEVFTRERLVNDRYQQDAWLRMQLRKEISCSSNATVQITQVRKASGSLGTSDSSSSPGTQESPQASPANTADTPKVLDWDCFEEALDYREQIRSLLIENQLDDRHDLNGTSLFRFKFDIAVVPGRNTESLATVKVTIASGDSPLAAGTAATESRPHKAGRGPASTEQCPNRAENIDLKPWEPVYVEWIESIERRLNQTQKEQRQRYDNNALSRSDYSDIINYLKGVYGLDTVKGLQSCEVAAPEALEKVDALPLELAGHTQWKQCLRSITKPQITQYSGKGSYLFQYNPSNTDTAASRDKPQVATAPFDQANRTHDPALLAQGALDSKLDDYFARRSVLLVLGIDEPLLSASGLGGVSGSIFARLLKLSFLHHSNSISLTGSANPATPFVVAPRTYRLIGIDKSQISEERYKQILKDSAATSSLQTNEHRGAPEDEWRFLLREGGYASYKPRCGMPTTDQGHAIEVLGDDVGISQVGLGEDSALLQDFPITAAELQPTSEPGIYWVRAQTGLYNFVSQLQSHAQPYTYAVAPQENGMMLHLRKSAGRHFDVGANVAGKLAAKDQMATEDSADSDEMRHIASIVGFGEADRGHKATFGWVINPQDMNTHNGQLKFNQSLKKYAVAALVSVPSWWRSLSITAVTAWRDPSGRDHEVTTEEPVHIEIPSDFEAFESTVLGSQGPELDESALDPIRLTAGPKTQQVLIPGRRLWRSTEVTLGDKPADSIGVLPNMKGIIATFQGIEDSSTPDEKASICGKRTGRDDVEIKRTVRVWTSQGAVTLPQPATIYILGKCSPATARN
jgi:hypothetical protein